MMYHTYSSVHPLTRQDVASQVLRQTVAFNQTQSKVLYWQTALADFGHSRVSMLPHGVSMNPYVNCRLSPAFRPAGQVAEPGSSGFLNEYRGLDAVLPPSSRTGLKPLATLARALEREYLRGHQQTMYERLEARREFALLRTSRAMRPTLRPLSIAEITRDLAGWTTPQAGASHGSTPEATLKRGKKASLKTRTN